MNYFHNPILPGFYPDPSITKKGEDFYLVTSTFNYFPGIPLFHSKDLVHWEQIGNVVTRESQAHLGEYQIYAPTIRYRELDDTFYVVTTLVKPGRYYENLNLYYTAKDPEGPWSEAHIIKGAEGIDPTLVFEGERTWYLGNMRVEPGNDANKQRWIWIQELDLNNDTLIGEKTILRKDGALYHAMCPEGPHIYHRGQWYYLLIAEGGTKHHHAVSIFRSKQITGPYEENPRNPVLTHRNMAMDSPIHSVGHADLVETDEGTWAVCLGVRPCGGAMYKNLGRETFLVPVIWEDEWPVFAPKTGRVELRDIAPGLSKHTYRHEQQMDNFKKERHLGHYWVMERAYEKLPYSLGKEGLVLTNARLLRRVRSMRWHALLKMEHPKEGAALILLSDKLNWIRLGYQQGKLVLTRSEKGKETEIWKGECEGITNLAIEGNMLDIHFFYRRKNVWEQAGDVQDGRILSDYNSFTGNMVGIESKEMATFTSFSLLPLR